MSEPARGRIAIKFGAGPSSSSSKPSRPTPPSSSLGKRPRSHHRHALGGASDSESEGDDRHGRHERITGFGSEGAETESRKREPKAPKEYVIKRQANRNWKESIRAKGQSRNQHPEDAISGHGDEPSADQEKSLQWGLTIKEKRPEEETRQKQPSPDTHANGEEHGVPSEAQQPRTVDDEAMDALLGRIPEKKGLVIAQPSEDDAYRLAVETAGAPSTLEDYEAMPVEEFGAALLRGMGWTGENLGPEVKQVRRRPNRLGLGAKELKEDEDLGGWDQNGRKKKPPRLSEYRREESKRKERRHEDSYRRERERETDGHTRDDRRDRERDRERERDYERRERHRDHERDRRR